MTLQSPESLNRNNFETPPWESRDKKNHLDVGVVEWCREYYMGEGGGFPRVRAVMSLGVQSCPWLVLTPKVFQKMI